SSNVRRITDRVQLLNVPTVGLGGIAFGGETGVRGNTGGIGLGSTPSFARMTARSIRFWSSRTFPGQEEEVKAAIVSGGMRRIDLRIRLAKSFTKWNINWGMSSDRSRNGGSSMGNTFRR